MTSFYVSKAQWTRVNLNSNQTDPLYWSWWRTDWPFVLVSVTHRLTPCTGFGDSQSDPLYWSRWPIDWPLVPALVTHRLTLCTGLGDAQTDPIYTGLVTHRLSPCTGLGDALQVLPKEFEIEERYNWRGPPYHMIIHALQTGTLFVYEIFRIGYCMRGNFIY